MLTQSAKIEKFDNTKSWKVGDSWDLYKWLRERPIALTTWKILLFTFPVTTNFIPSCASKQCSSTRAPRTLLPAGGAAQRPRLGIKERPESRRLGKR